MANDNLYKWNKNTRPILKSNEILYVSDPLHVLKRGRYRFVSHQLVKLNKSDIPINIQNIEEITNLPHIVFESKKITKMHDFLPLRLFDIEIFNILEYAQIYNACAYFIPFTLMIEALSGKDLQIEDRVDYLEIIFYYCHFYKIIFDKFDEKQRAIQKGSKNCVLFDMRLINDIQTTVLSINTIIQNFDGLISLNRISTNPLEHHFGLMRDMSHYKHDFDTYIQMEIKSKIMNDIEKNVISNLVSSRKDVFGEIIELENKKYGDNHYFSNIDIALSILWKYGFPTKLIQKENECFYELAYKSFIHRIKKNENKVESKNNKYTMNSRDLCFNPSSRAFIDERLANHDLMN